MLKFSKNWSKLERGNCDLDLFYKCISYLYIYIKTNSGPI